jgi:hypothetical protein
MGISIDEAIKNLGYWLENKPVIPASKLRASTRLGIEAMEWYKRWRAVHHAAADYLLPGETEELKGEQDNDYRRSY